MTRKLKFDEKEMTDLTEFQKKSISAFAEFAYKYDDDKSFDIFSMGVALIVSNIIGSYGIKNIGPYLEELMGIIKQIHNSVQENACYMEYKKGKKISEGRFN